jgi:hypothetical protein
MFNYSNYNNLGYNFYFEIVVPIVIEVIPVGARRKKRQKVSVKKFEFKIKIIGRTQTQKIFEYSIFGLFINELHYNYKINSLYKNRLLINKYIQAKILNKLQIESLIIGKQRLNLFLNGEVKCSKKFLLNKEYNINSLSKYPLDFSNLIEAQERIDINNIYDLEAKKKQVFEKSIDITAKKDIKNLLIATGLM